MPPITVSAEVDRPAEAAFAYVTDPTRFPEWQAGVVGGHMDGDDRNGVPAVGARCVTVRRIGGAERASTSELVTLDPPRAWAVRGLDGPIRAAVDVTVEPLGADRSRVAIAVDFTGHGIGKLLVPLVVRREARKEMPANLARLKDRLEDGAQASGGAP
jgi:carbon monoxide dehydrogenase subunit G